MVHLLLLCGPLLTDTRADEKAASTKLLLCERNNACMCDSVSRVWLSLSEGAKKVRVFLFNRMLEGLRRPPASWQKGTAERNTGEILCFYQTMKHIYNQSLQKKNIPQPLHYNTNCHTKLNLKMFSVSIMKIRAQSLPVPLVFENPHTPRNRGTRAVVEISPYEMGRNSKPSCFITC